MRERRAQETWVTGNKSGCIFQFVVTGDDFAGSMLLLLGILAPSPGDEDFCDMAKRGSGRSIGDKLQCVHALRRM